MVGDGQLNMKVVLADSYGKICDCCVDVVEEPTQNSRPRSLVPVPVLYLHEPPAPILFNRVNVKTKIWGVGGS